MSSLRPQRPVAPLAVLPLLFSLALIGCHRAGPTGWTPLWQSSREVLAAGDLWMEGVRLDRTRTMDVDGPGAAFFRARLANDGPDAAEVVLTGPSGSRRWPLDPGEERFLEAEVEPGTHELSGSPAVLVGEPRVGRPLARGRLLVVLLADTFRADHLTPDLTPRILGAFAQGRRWTDVTANGAWTLPSVASLFTSRPVLGLSFEQGGLIGIPKGVPTWAEQLERAGFTGGAAVANYSVHAQNGFSAGFASYRVPSPKGRKAPPDASWVLDEGWRFLTAHHGEDAFLYLHFMDTHEPFRDHEAGLPAPPSMAVLGHRKRPATEAETELLRTLYRGEVRHLDEAVGPFVDSLPDEAVVVFTADHGEALGEHGGVWGHALTLFQEVVSVPLLMRGPAVADAEAVEAGRPVQLLDLGPTLLESMGVDPAPGMAGASLLGHHEGQRRESPIVSATFSAGPLRWAWREGKRKVVFRAAAQTAGQPGGRTVQESDPLPAGAWVRSVEGDPAGREDAPEAVPPEMAPLVARLFAQTAGSMVPGPVLLIMGSEGAAEASFESPVELEPLHLWGTSAIEVERSGDRWTVRAAEGYPLAAVAFRLAQPAADGPPPSFPVEMVPLPATLPWPDRTPGRSYRVEPGPPPVIRGPGVYLWWNEPRSVEISGQQETVERLHALGYL